MPVNSFDNYPLSWKPDRSKLTRPYYRSLAEDLERRIRSGELSEGTKLPPQREIADYLDLNYTTITRVYDICREKGLIYGAVGRGTFVAPHSAEDITISADDGGGFIEMGGINGFSEYSEPIERATRSVIEKGYLRSLYEYSHPAGQPHQIAAGIRWMEQLGAHASPEQTAVFSGAQNALAVTLMSLFQPGDRIATDEFTYSNFIELAKMLHLVLVPVKGDADGMLPDELERHCAGGRIKGVYLIPTCSNPTTVTIPEERRRDLVSVIRRRGLLLIEDDIATWLRAAGGESVIPSMFDMTGGKSIYICGMTKSLCPGLRVAFAAFDEDLRQRMLHGIANVNIKTSALDAEIITELILNGDAYEIAARKRQLTEQSCRVFDKYFPGCCRGVSYYKWLPISAKMPAAEVESGLMERGVRVYHSKRFAAAPSPDRAFLRLSMSSAGSSRRLEQGLGTVKDFLLEKGLI